MPVSDLHLNKVIQNFSEQLGGVLPGEAAHARMRAMPLAALQFRFNHAEPPRPGSVLILLQEHEGLITFPLILRPFYEGAHGGQVSLPGGKAEPGEQPEDTALREAAEEIGIDPKAVEVLGRLSDLHVIPSNFMVTPVVAFTRQQPVYRPDPHEVDRILVGTLNELLAPDAENRRELVVRGHRIDAPCFLLDGEVVWGATAMILSEIRLLLSGL